jgi:hypothetical protein
MPSIPYSRVETYRRQTFRTAQGLRLTSIEQAIEFVNQRGFIFFWPIKDALLPSLWAAVAGDRPVADAHDDPGHVSWGWKDSMLSQRCWYYARILRRRNTFISLELAPYFYALSANYGSPEEDYLIQYEAGQLTQESKLIYEALLKNGMMDTISLRKAAHLTNRQSDSRFNKAMDDLMADFKILPVAVTEAGAWHYSYAYDIVTHHFPDLAERARFISEEVARCKLVETCLLSLGAARVIDLSRLFKWEMAYLQRTLQQLENKGLIYNGLEIEGQTGQWLAAPDLLNFTL